MGYWFNPDVEKKQRFAASQLHAESRDFLCHGGHFFEKKTSASKCERLTQDESGIYCHYAAFSLS